MKKLSHKEMNINFSPGSSLRTATFGLCLLAFCATSAFAQTGKPSSKQPAPKPNLEALAAVPEKEEDFYKLLTVPIPEDVVLEVGGLASLPDGRLAVSTRRGEVWLISNPYMTGNTLPHYKRFAQGLHEALGLAYQNNTFYLTQRSELTRLRDTDGDDKADLYESVYSWPLSGNYHEYAYGPVIQPNGNMLVTLNLGPRRRNDARGRRPPLPGRLRPPLLRRCLLLREPGRLGRLRPPNAPAARRLCR